MISEMERRAWHKSVIRPRPRPVAHAPFDHGQCNDGDVRGCRYHAGDSIEAAGQSRIKQHGIRMNGENEFKRLILVSRLPT